MQSGHQTALIWQQRTLHMNEWNRPRLSQSEAVLDYTHEARTVAGRLYLQATVREAIIISDIAVNVRECSNKIGQHALESLLRSLLPSASSHPIAYQCISASGPCTENYTEYMSDFCAQFHASCPMTRYLVAHGHLFHDLPQ